MVIKLLRTVCIVVRLEKSKRSKPPVAKIQYRKRRGGDHDWNESKVNKVLKKRTKSGSKVKMMIVNLNLLKSCISRGTIASRERKWRAMHNGSFQADQGE